MIYNWWLFLHFVGIFAFLLAHGASVTVTFQLRKERDPARIEALLQLSRGSLAAFYVGLAVLTTAGIILGFIPGSPGTWWGQGWIWTALALLIAVSGAMIALARPYYRRLERAVQAWIGGSAAVSEAEIAQLLTSRRPLVIAGLGFGGLLAILWLMVLKPF
ncbi:MAG: DUF4191 domain-containing protein [Actinomycetota bacterium]|nr:DUF4191 domain-containing protein [Actinomycetota bacterium]